MRKIFTIIAACLFSVSAAFAQPELPDGFVSVYSVNSEAEGAPITIDGGTSAQVLGPAQGWGESTAYDLSNYEKLAFKITYDPADAGKQVAIRFNVNLSVKLQIVTLPETGTSFVEEIFLSQYADADGKVLVGGIVFYNGASHWSFSYDGTAATEACTIDYIAVNEKIELPFGYVSFYSVKPESERAPMTVDLSKDSQQLAGPADWGNSTDYDLSDYSTIAFKISYDPADAGNQVAIRFNINGSVKLHIITLPTEGTSVVEEIDLTQYADEEGTVVNGGIVFYNGKTHWSFSYDGTPATQPCKIDYIALKKKLDLPEGYVSVYDIGEETERAPLLIEGGKSLQVLGAAEGWGSSTDYDFSNYEKLVFKINYASEDAGSQMAIRFSVNGTGASLHMVTLPTEGTSVIEEINLEELADADDKVLFGGIVIYNGEGHWSFSYDGTAATQDCTIDYIALKPKPAVNVHDIPEGYVSVYEVIGDTTMLAPLSVAGEKSYQLLGSSENWGSSLDYDFSAYDTLAIQIVFDTLDIGKEVALRFSVDGWTNLYIFPLDTMPDGQTIVREKIYLPEYANLDGEVLMGGIVFYNGEPHWSFSYINPATQPVTIDFVALNPSTITGIRDVVRTKDPNALVNVYTITGLVVRQNVKYSEATNGLKQGLYIVGHEKVFVAGPGY
ncbi:hypothetical protein [uncultured Sunxiuqinia sp.]|uniref:hypothetical protein n=1 Tax=uncultured Sunxiuqinia sp. TaxID=1573825 RepID=UPI002AA66933|nr:hypothetical protein [uncultured Sunxiuqinia sp.]